MHDGDVGTLGLEPLAAGAGGIVAAAREHPEGIVRQIGDQRAHRRLVVIFAGALGRSAKDADAGRADPMLDPGLAPQPIQDLRRLLRDHVGQIEKAQRIRAARAGARRICRRLHQFLEAGIDRLAPIGAGGVASAEARHDGLPNLSIACVT
jgi:hypothetical protein